MKLINDKKNSIIGLYDFKLDPFNKKYGLFMFMLHIFIDILK